jgi:SAM-dependent methyltransferase
MDVRGTNFGHTQQVWTREEVKCEFDRIINSACTEKVVDFTNKCFSEESFQSFFSYLKLCPVSRLVLSKNSLKEEQICKVLALANSNSKKGIRINNECGEPFGPVYTDYTTYYAEKRLAFIAQLEKAADSSTPVQDYKAILNETVAVALEKIIEAVQSDNKDKVLRVLDFGCGEGKDTIPLLRIWECLKETGKDIEVVGVDADFDAIANFKALLTPSEKGKVTFYTGPFVEFASTKPVDLFISSFTWPYRPSENNAESGSEHADFDEVWEKTKRAVKTGGFIAGHLFGAGKEANSGMTYHSEEGVRALLADGFEIVWFYVEDSSGIRPNGHKREIFGGEVPAWGDLYHFVARKL